MAFKLIESAQRRWRMMNAPNWSRSSAPERSSSTASSWSGPARMHQPKAP